MCRPNLVYMLHEEIPPHLSTDDKQASNDVVASTQFSMKKVTRIQLTFDDHNGFTLSDFWLQSICKILQNLSFSNDLEGLETERRL